MSRILEEKMAPPIGRHKTTFKTESLPHLRPATEWRLVNWFKATKSIGAMRLSLYHDLAAQRGTRLPWDILNDASKRSSCDFD